MHGLSVRLSRSANSRGDAAHGVAQGRGMAGIRLALWPRRWRPWAMTNIDPGSKSE